MNGEQKSARLQKKDLTKSLKNNIIYRKAFFDSRTAQRERYERINFHNEQFGKYQGR